MGLKLLNKFQEEQFKKLAGFYKFFYICGTCGSVYGSDHKEETKECPICESLREAKEKKK